ncbi:hypothetical protein HED60_17350 [Planctomycetales bacterium ZRK34]|nr:hypothetical protein HED60_17350 [Planctomycetales bacterium ZRK34]
MTRFGVIAACLLTLLTGVMTFAESPLPLPDRLGVTHVAGRYHLTNDDFLNEGADQILTLGSRVIKIYLSLDPTKPPSRYYPFNTDWPNVDTLVELAQTKPYRAVFDKPFTTYILTVYRPGVSANYWVYKLTNEQKHAEKQAIYELARHLLTTYRGTGKTFVIQHWEGDWSVRAGLKDKAVDPPAERFDRMAAWLAARQAGVDQARAQVADTDVRVFCATEVNLVKIGMIDERPCVTNRVLPKVTLDLVSYSSYDTQQDPALLRRALDYIAEHAPDREPFGARNVYLGEFGLPENKVTAEKMQRVITGAIDTAMDWGCPYIVYWQVYCNEPIREPVDANDDCRGFWLIRPDGSRSIAWSILHNYLTEQTPQPR